MLYQTHARVDLGALHANLAAIRRAVGPEREVLMAVKADAYGHGAAPVAVSVEAAGLADRFGVATVPEGMRLRHAGVRAPILKFSPAFAEELPAAIAADLTLTIADPATSDAAQDAAQAAGRTVAVHVKVDIGMGRIGAAPADVPALARHLRARCPRLRVEGIFTHFPASDVPAQDAATTDQIASFRRAIADFEGQWGRRVPLRHAANSGAVLAHPDAWFDLVRPGIMAYGYYPDPATPRTIPLRPALTWASRVSFRKHVPAGTTVSYGRTWTAPGPTWIATVPVGYGDGFDRHLSNRGRVLIRGRDYPVVGRVCMDQTMIDLGPVTDIDVGEPVILLGSSGEASYTAADMAADLGTIPYEVCCAIAPRVSRLYDGP